ncbi:multidrug transporter [Amylibacter marinus]|uniref:Multidrug transporter n=1 Tax=Amylibacter marinus TaxID=1475483 RepID=A0ABQ5VSV4_9RHOB|nr:SMR family transporter [Amylibacter marinus]GLQ34410.1 multidrug transporter [Amylibacter marinus]
MQAHTLYLCVAIIAETIATTLLKSSNGFTKLWPSIGALVGFAITLYLLALTLRYMPVGVVYAIWSGAGIVLITIAGIIFFKQHLDFAGYLGIALIVTGVVVLQAFSKISLH